MTKTPLPPPDPEPCERVPDEAPIPACGDNQRPAEVRWDSRSGKVMEWACEACPQGSSPALTLKGWRCVQPPAPRSVVDVIRANDTASTTATWLVLLGLTAAVIARYQRPLLAPFVAAAIAATGLTVAASVLLPQTPATGLLVLAVALLAAIAALLSLARR